MKDILILMIAIFSLCFFLPREEKIIIPDTALRFRVLANSNSIDDQNIKLQVRDLLQKELSTLIGKETDINKVKNIINSNLENLKEKVSTITDDFTISFGNNYFPDKFYRGIKYDEGEYESLVVVLGNGQGDNWWCVLFPPLCLLEAEEKEETTEVEYRFLVKDLVDKYFYSK